MPRVSVYSPFADPSNTPPFWRIQRSLAERLVLTGDALWLGDDSLRFLHCEGPSKESAQGIAYEKIALDCYPLELQGGLTRTEHKPAPFQQFKGARVGHQ